MLVPKDCERHDARRLLFPLRVTQKAVTLFAGTTEGQIFRGLARPRSAVPPIRFNTALRPPFLLLINHLMTPADRQPQWHGFTLIELLVVVAIIAVLAALLFPVISVTKLKVQSTRCTSNVKQLGICTALYITDHE